jgi:hypothetical protein
MTTVAMIFGMVPLALALGEGAEQRAPMGRAVIGGLITSTVLTLFVVPVVYTLLDDFVGLFRKKGPPSRRIRRSRADRRLRRRTEAPSPARHLAAPPPITTWGRGARMDMCGAAVLRGCHNLVGARFIAPVAEAAESPVGSGYSAAKPKRERSRLSNRERVAGSTLVSRIVSTCASM